jgi:ABC-type antimicrobial peptide transport system permease subunit
MEQYVQTANNILEGVTIIGMVAASVSLFVAGLGILNIMSTAVLERTREIGVRKALGGDEWTILLQFLIEAMLISLFGGVAGLLLGGITSIAVAWIAGFPLEPKMLFNGLSLVIAVGVGLVSGLYPAYRAAQLRPVEALRYE